MTPTRSTGDSTNWFPIRKSCGSSNSSRRTRLLQARCGSPGTSRKPAEEPKSRCSARASRQESGPRTTKRALFLPYGNWLRSWSRTASRLHQRSDRRGLWPHGNRLRLWNEPQNGHRHLSVVARLRLSQNRAALLGDGPAGIEPVTPRIPGLHRELQQAGSSWHILHTPAAPYRASEVERNDRHLPPRHVRGTPQCILPVHPRLGVEI